MSAPGRRTAWHFLLPPSSPHPSFTDGARVWPDSGLEPRAPHVPADLEVVLLCSCALSGSCALVQLARSLGLVMRLTEIFGGREGFTRWWAWVGAADIPGGFVHGKYRCADSTQGLKIMWETPRVRTFIEKLRRRVHMMTPSAQNTGLRRAEQTQRNMTFTRMIGNGQIWGSTELQQAKYRDIDWRASVVPSCKEPEPPIQVCGDDTPEGREQARKELVAAEAAAEKRALESCAQEKKERDMIKTEAQRDAEEAMRRKEAGEHEVEMDSDEEEDGVLRPTPLLTNYEAEGRSAEDRVKEGYGSEATPSPLAALATMRWRYGAPMPRAKSSQGTAAVSNDGAALNNLSALHGSFSIASVRWVHAGRVGDALTKRHVGNAQGALTERGHYQRIFRDCGSESLPTHPRPHARPPRHARHSSPPPPSHPCL